MKRIYLAMIVAVSAMLMLQACSSATGSNSAIQGGRGKVVGNWEVTNVTLDGIPDGAVQGLFGEKSYKCFVGSTWHLTNSGNGSYTLSPNSTCGAVTQKIFWSAAVADQTFQFKKLYDNDKARNVTSGYRLVLTALSNDQMELKSPIEFGDKVAYVVMTLVPAAK